MTRAESTFDRSRFEALRRECGVMLGTPLTLSGVTGSTNDDALEAASNGAPHGATFVADLQTRGRGRRGHTWSSPAGQNLTASILLRPRLAPHRASALTLVTGLAVRAALAPHITHRIEIKWPNDVVCRKKKLAGILVESQLRGDHLVAVVVGVGINVGMREPPGEIRDLATSLALLGAESVSRETVLAAVLGELEPRLETYAAEGLDPSLDELAAHDALSGLDVEVEDVRGKATGIAPDGALLLEDRNGVTHRMTSGAVRVLGQAR